MLAGFAVRLVSNLSAVKRPGLRRHSAEKGGSKVQAGECDLGYAEAYEEPSQVHI